MLTKSTENTFRSIAECPTSVLASKFKLSEGRVAFWMNLAEEPADSRQMSTKELTKCAVVDQHVRHNGQYGSEVVRSSDNGFREHVLQCGYGAGKIT